jgi:hypothetical protein
MAEVARYRGASVLKKMLAEITSGDNVKMRAANAPAVRLAIREAARYMYHELKLKHTKDTSRAVNA